MRSALRLRHTHRPDRHSGGRRKVQPLGRRVHGQEEEVHSDSKDCEDSDRNLHQPQTGVLRPSVRRAVTLDAVGKTLVLAVVEH